MTNTKSTKRALLMSVLSMFLCVVMLAGTTFAWFTDSVTSSNNIIKSGNLDIVLEYWTGKEWKDVKDSSDILTGDLWEPGYADVAYLRFKNNGSLDLKYKLGVNIVKEIGGINQANEPFMLSDYIYYDVFENVNGEKNAFADRAAAMKDTTETTKISAGYSKSGNLVAGTDYVYLAMVVYMPTSVGNDANHNGVAIPQIDLGINIMATQMASESDSFGTDYDKEAPWLGGADTTWYNDTDTEFTLDAAEKLAGLAELVNAGNSFEGKTIKLGADIDLNNVNWTPIGKSGSPFKGTFIGTGYTISNLRSVGGKHVGLIGATYVGAHIEGVTIENAYVSGEDYVGAVVGGGYLATNCIKNCTVTGATVLATPYQKADGTYDGGAKAGVIVGQAYNGNIIGNTVKDSTVTAYRDLGGIAGMLAFDGNVEIVASGNTVEDVTLNYVGVAGNYDGGKVNENMGVIVGRVGAHATVTDDNTATGVTENKANEGAVMIYTLEELIAFANNVNSGNSYNGKTVILGADIDLLNMEWTPIGNSTNKFQGTFDGNGKTISNLKVSGNKSYVGLFGFTTEGAIMNLTLENATVSGYVGVGALAGSPYTSKFTNITLKGHVEVNGLAYVGGVGGRNAYANWDQITVDVDETSYVKAISTEDGKAYRTYVGGVIGFMGEDGHTVSNVTSNIDVIGDVCDIGGIVGIAHYNNNFKNITCTGDVTNLVSSENDGDDAATDVLETGLIAGVWHNMNGTTVTFTNISATGKISTPNVNPASEFANNGLIGKAYSATGTGTLKIINVFKDEAGAVVHEELVSGEVLLYSVSDVTATEYQIPKNVTTLRSGLFTNNTAIKTVHVPASVTDFGGVVQSNGQGASGSPFKNSAVETIVLAEGITELTASAIEQAINLKSITIPASVTTIGVEALAGTGITELVIPATVKNIGYGAFRDNKSLKSVTIEGDIHIPSYSFRSCVGLETVKIKGLNVTFEKGMIFTCYDTGDGRGIKIYVANEGIKDRLLAADSAATTYGGYEVICEKTPDTNGIYTDTTTGDTYAYAKDNATLNTAVTEGAGTVYLDSGTYTFPASSIKAGTTILCDEGTVFENGTGLNANGATVIGATFSNPTGTAGTSTVNGTYKNCTFDGSNGLRWCYAGETVVFENCTFSGDVYGVHFDGGANEAIFRNCTFSGFNAMGGAITKLTMEGCTFKANGRSGYNGINLWGSTDMIDCTFVFDGKAGTEWVDACGDNKVYNFTNCVVTDGETETPIEKVVGNYGTGNTITVDGVSLATDNDMLKAAVDGGATEVMLRNGDYDLNGNQKDGLTFIGIGDNVKVANTTKYASGKAIGAIWKAINLENVTVTNTVYTMADGGNATFTNVNFAAGFRQGYGKSVVFKDCTFGSNSEGYALHFQTDSASEGGVITLDGCEFEGGKVHLGGKRAYEFTGCDFAAGTDFQVWSNITLDGCTVDGEAVTSENIATLFPALNLEKVTLK